MSTPEKLQMGEGIPQTDHFGGKCMDQMFRPHRPVIIEQVLATNSNFDNLEIVLSLIPWERFVCLSCHKLNAHPKLVSVDAADSRQMPRDTLWKDFMYNVLFPFTIVGYVTHAWYCIQEEGHGPAHKGASASECWELLLALNRKHVNDVGPFSFIFHTIQNRW